MGLYGIMNTAVSGMNAQSSKLATVADNISNANTIGYKGVKTSFSTMVGAGGSAYESGTVNTSVVQTVGQQGAFNYTGKGTDLAVNGNGFFPVQDSQGGTYYTRAGDFVLDKNGNMVNANGYKLVNADGAQVEIDLTTPAWQASTKGQLSTSLPSDTPKHVPAPVSGNPVTDFDFKTSVSAFDQNGNTVQVEVVYTKVNETVDSSGKVTSSEWLVQARDPNDPTNKDLVPTSTTLKFTGDGKLDPTSPQEVTLNTPNGEPLTLDLSGTVTTGDTFSVTKVDIDGYGPSNIESVRIEKDGRVFGVYGSGAERQLDQINVVKFANPEGLQVQTGNVYAATDASGDPAIGIPGENGFGEIFSGATEGSNVDLASELTEMIQAQRTYSANTKVFNASSELLQELNNLR